MTAYELYNLALKYSFETSTSEYADNYIPFINLLLAENFNLNNTLLRMKGLDDLEDIPLIETQDDEIPYEEEINRSVLPIGLAMCLNKEDEQALYNVHVDMYDRARKRVVNDTQVIFTDMK